MAELSILLLALSDYIIYHIRLHLLFCLQIIEDDEFLQVETSRDHRVKIPREVPMCLDVFNKEVSETIKAITNEIPGWCSAILINGSAIDTLLPILNEIKCIVIQMIASHT